MAKFSPFLTDLRTELVEIMHQEQEAATTRTLAAIERVVSKFMENVSQNGEKSDRCIFTPSCDEWMGTRCNVACIGLFCTEHQTIVRHTPSAPLKKPIPHPSDDEWHRSIFSEIGRAKTHTRKNSLANP